MIVVALTPGFDSAAGEANRAAIQAALDNAPDRSTIGIPQGHWYCHMGNSPAIEVNKNVVFEFSGGPRLSSLKFGPESPGDPYYGFRLHPIDADIIFRNGAVDGPTDPGVIEADGEPAVITKGIYADAFEVGRFRLENMRLGGKWRNAADGNKNREDGWWHWEIIDCDISARMNGVSLFCSHDSNQVSCHIENSYFHDCGNVPADLSTQGRGAFLYFSPSVSVSAKNCRFERNYRWSIQHNSSGGSSKAPAYIRYEDCVWDDVRVCLLPSDLGPTVIDNPNGRFHYQGFMVRHDTRILGGQLYGGQLGVNHYETDRPMSVRVVGTQFHDMLAVNCGGNGARWNLDGITVVNNTRNMSSLITNVPAMAPRVSITNSRLENHVGSVGAHIFARNGYWHIGRNDFVGSCLYSGVLGDGNLQEAVVERNRFDMPGEKAIRDDAGKWEIAGNSYTGGTIQPAIEDKRVRQLVT